MARLTGCCFCFDSLRDGARAVGITMLVLGSLGLVCNIAGTAMLFQEENGVRMTGGTIAQIAIQFVVGILHIVMNALLVHGVNSSRRGMILGWLIFAGIVTGLQTAAVVILFMVFLIVGVSWGALLMLGVAALIGVFWYWFVVVLHYYQEMNEQNGFVYGKQDNAL